MSYDSRAGNYSATPIAVGVANMPKINVMLEELQKHLKRGPPKVKNLESDPTLQKD